LLELNQIAEDLTLSMGAKPAFKGYLGFAHSLCTSVNEHVVHGVPSRRKLVEGDVIGLDFGLVFEGFYGDSAVTLGIGRISDKAKKLMQITKDSLYAAIDAAREGNTLKDIARAIEDTIRPHKYGIVKEFVGHGIGTKLHEDPQVANYEAGASNLKLRSGMTIAIEPMINEGTHRIKVLEDKWTVATEDGGLSAHYEHTIAITKGEPEILTAWTNILSNTEKNLDSEILKRGAYGQRGSNPS
ncbi:MAG: type I methionyl aminopeptidase, partial [Pseudomonadota bacterium]